jgi:hypothetical protein
MSHGHSSADALAPRSGASAVASDRDHNTHLSFPEGRFGVDTIALRGPVDPSVADRLPRQRLTREFDPETGEVVDRLTSARPSIGSDLYFRIDAAPSGGVNARVEFSAPRMLRGDNRRPANLAELRQAVLGAYERVDHEVPWLCSPEDLTVARLDIARDFTNVVDPSVLLEALWRVDVPRMTGMAYRSKDGRGVQTLVQGVRRHSGTMYHRGPQYLARAVGAKPEARAVLERLAQEETGVVRFEMQLRREQAASEGLGRVRDVLTAHLGRIASAYFNGKYRFGEIIAGPAWKVREACSAAVAAGEAKRLITAFGQLFADTHGAPLARHPKTTNQYRTDYRRYGLSVGDPQLPERTPVRFDLDLGRVVEAG